MASILQQAMSAVESAMNTNMAETVSISEGRYTTTGVKATFGRTRKELIADNNGSSIEVNICDVLISKANYLLNEFQIVPSANHVIIRGDGSKYKPTPMIPGEPVWRWLSEVQKTVYRIHVIEVAN